MIETAESPKAFAQEAAQHSLQQILKAKTYISDTVANTAETLTSNVQNDIKANNQ